MHRIKIIALDMDGTLLASDHWTIPQDNVDAILRAHAAGICICICTGRMLEDASDFARRMNLPCMLIACNGTRAADGLLPGAHVFWKCGFDSCDAHAALDILLSSRLSVNALEDGLVTTVTPDKRWKYHLVKRGLVKAAYGAEAIRAAADRSVMKFFAVADAASEQELIQVRKLLKEKLPHLIVTSSNSNNIELMPPLAGKGAALEAMVKHLGFCREEVMAIGDAPNDLSMLEYAWHSVAMGNADEDIQKICRYVTLSNDECGVARMIERVLDAQGETR